MTGKQADPVHSLRLYRQLLLGIQLQDGTVVHFVGDQSLCEVRGRVRAFNHVVHETVCQARGSIELRVALQLGVECRPSEPRVFLVDLLHTVLRCLYCVTHEVDCRRSLSDSNTIIYSWLVNQHRRMLVDASATVYTCDRDERGSACRKTIDLCVDRRVHLIDRVDDEQRLAQNATPALDADHNVR